MHASKELSTKTLVKRLANLVKGLWLQYVLAVGGGAVSGFLSDHSYSKFSHSSSLASFRRSDTALFFCVTMLFALGLMRGILRYIEHFFGHCVKTLSDFRMHRFPKTTSFSTNKIQ